MTTDLATLADEIRHAIAAAGWEHRGTAAGIERAAEAVAAGRAGWLLAHRPGAPAHRSRMLYVARCGNVTCPAEISVGLTRGRRYCSNACRQAAYRARASADGE